MTDTTTTTTDQTNSQALDPEQRARAAALRAANRVLAATGFASRDAVDPIDLINIASWITTGLDPWLTPTTVRGKAHRILDNTLDEISEGVGVDVDAPLDTMGQQ